MAEKGGKGFSMRRGKAAVKTPVTKQGNVKGKDSDPNNARHVQIDSSDSDSEGFVELESQISPRSGKESSDTLKAGKKVTFESMKSGGKTSFETPTAKGDWGKGGKYSSSGKAGGKGSLPQATPLKSPLMEVELKLEIELPKNARILMDCEAAHLLQGIEEHLTLLSKDPKLKIPESFDKALQYSKIGNHYTNIQPVREALDTLKMYGVTDGEICMIGNIFPETVDEVYALIPSLKAHRIKNERALRDALNSLSKFGNSTKTLL